MIRECLRRIKRMFQYAWYVWQTADHDWDYYGLLKLWEIKLGWTASCIDKYGNTVNKDKTVKSIKTARALIKRIMADNYTWMYWNHYEDRIIWTPVPMGTMMDQSKAWEQKSNIPVVIRFGKEPSNEGKDLEYLCILLRKHLFTWWD